MRPALAAPIVLAAGSIAAAQSVTLESSVVFDLRWSEYMGNENGVIDPGERALLMIDASFTNQNGVAAFSPPIGSFGSGTVRGIGSGFVDLHGASASGYNTRGTWNVDQSAGFGVNGEWDVTGGQGQGTSANGGADITNMQFGQLVSTPNGINTTNPIISIWTGLWTPESYEPRTVSFTVRGSVAAGASVASVALRLSPTFVASVFVPPSNLFYGLVTIPIVPAPAPLLLIPSAIIIRAPRRRRTESRP